MLIHIEFPGKMEPQGSWRKFLTDASQEEGLPLRASDMPLRFLDSSPKDSQTPSSTGVA